MNLYVEITDDTGKKIASRVIDLEQYKTDKFYRMRVFTEMNHTLKLVLPKVKKSKKKVKQ